jgi:hypothetical protein
MYRPKEEVALKGYIRRITAGKFGDVEPLGDVGGAITYSVKDSRGNEIAKGTTNLNAFGAFDFKFALPDNMNLGQGFVEISGAGSSTQHYFQVQEFRRPEFEVTAKGRNRSAAFCRQFGECFRRSQILRGRRFGKCRCELDGHANPTNYTPPNRDDYTFGTWTPWWNFRGYDYESDGGYRGGGGSSQSFKGRHDASGKHLLKIDFESVKPPRPYNVTAQVSVQDVNRQTFASSTN